MRPDFDPLFRIRKFPMPRGRKRGRPRTGSKPVVPVRLAAKQVKKIAKLAELEGVDRSTVLRQLIDIGLDSPQVTLLMRRPGHPGADRSRARHSRGGGQRAGQGHAIGRHARAVGRDRGERPARRGRASGSDGCVCSSPSEAPPISVGRIASIFSMVRPICSGALWVDHVAASPLTS